MMLSKPSSIKKAATHASGNIMLTYVCVQNVIKIGHVVQELRAFSLTANRRTNRQMDRRTHLVIIVQTQGSIIVQTQGLCNLTSNTFKYQIDHYKHFIFFRNSIYNMTFVSRCSWLFPEDLRAIARSFDKSRKLMILYQNPKITCILNFLFKHSCRVSQQIKIFHV